MPDLARQCRPPLLAIVLIATASLRTAALPMAPPDGVTPDVTTEALKDVTVVERLGQQMPLDLPFVDDAGKAVKLSDHFGGKKPVILQLGYYGCPMLCGLVTENLVKCLKQVNLVAGRDFELVYISIDPTEKPSLAAAKKGAIVQEYGRGSEAAAGFHLLTGRQGEITKIAQAVGFGYKWVPAAQQYSHPAVLMILAPDGKITRYLYFGQKLEPQTMRLSLVEASDGKVGSTADRFILTCFQYDGRQGRYAMVAVKMMRWGGVLTVLVLGSVLFWLFRREPLAASRRPPSSPEKSLEEHK